MKNVINYYYDLNVERLNKKDGYFYFYLNDEKYYFKIFESNINEVKHIYDLNKRIRINNYLIHEIISNNKGDVITFTDGAWYILYKVCANERQVVTLADISRLSKEMVSYNKELVRFNWPILWSNKIDYLEYQINQMGKKYPYIVDSFSYYVGLAENAISYVQNTINDFPNVFNNEYVISHKRVGKDGDSFYSPINMIIDHKARDVAEYIKLSFYNKNKNVFKELEEYFKHNYFSIFDMRILFGRILFPSFYFDLYDDILDNKKDEKEMIMFINNTNEYEKYLFSVFNFLRKYYDIPVVYWLEKKETNLH